MSLTKSTIQTRSGIYLDLKNPRKEDVLLSDISHALARVNRFNGHTKKAYSVAQHSILVSHVLWLNGEGDPKVLLAGLLHDAAEAYLGDVSSPLKRLIQGYEPLERRMMDIIIQALSPCLQGLSEDKWGLVKKADRTILYIESKYLMEKPFDGISDTFPFGNFCVVAADAEEAQEEFETRFLELLEDCMAETSTPKEKWSCY